MTTKLQTALKIALVILFLIVLFLWANNSYGVDFRRAETFEDAYGATCRVSVSGARGTGFFIGTHDDKAYIVTNYHVVTKNQTATLDFWTNGKKESISGRIEWRYYLEDLPADFAVIVVSATELKAIDPPYIALGGADAKPSVGAMIISSGAPDGRFPQAWKGQVLEYYSGKTAIFSPPPVPGQSGSPICEFVDGELFVTGILTWLIGEKGRDDSKGGAIPIMNIYQSLKRRPSQVDFHGPETSPIPPDATECAEQLVRAYEFYSDDCAACLSVAPEVVKLEAQGIVERVNTDTSQGAVFAEQCGIKELPTVVVIAGDAIEKVVSFDELKRLGTTRAITNAVDSVKARFSYETALEENDSANALPDLNLPLPSAPKEPETQEPPKTEQEPQNSTDDNATATFREHDFRNRPPVRESARDVGVFEDSDRRWLGRGGRLNPTPLKPRPKAEQEPQCPPQTPTEPQIDEPQNETPNNNNGRILGKDRKGIIGNAQENLFKKYAGELEKFVDAQIGKVIALIRQSTGAIFSFLLCAVVLGVFIADGIKRLFCLIVAKGKDWWRAIVRKAAMSAAAQAAAFSNFAAQQASSAAVNASGTTTTTSTKKTTTKK